LIDNAKGDCPFTVWPDKDLTASFTVSQPATVRSLLGCVAGSILDVYGPGEFEWDRFTVKFHASRGINAGVMIRYGKDLTDVKKTTDTSNIWTGIVPFWVGLNDEEQETLVTLSEKVIYAENSDDYVYRMVIPVDMSSYFLERPTEEQLRTRAESYVRANAETGIPATIEISFVALWQTEEYKNIAPLQKLRLCDTVTVYHRGLGIENSAKIV
jgi:phage minor structural protein